MTDIEAQLHHTLRERAERVPVERDIAAIIERADATGATPQRRPQGWIGATVNRVAGDNSLPVIGEPLARRPPFRHRSRLIEDAGRRRRRPAVLIGSAAAVTMLATGLIVVAQRDTAPDIGQAPVVTSTTAAPHPAPLELEHSLDGLGWPPHILISDGWEVVSADQRSDNEGLVSFERDGQIAYIGWNRANQSVSDKGLDDATELGAAVLLGEPVTMLQPSGGYAESDIRDLIASGELPAEGVLAQYAPGATAAPPASDLPDHETTPDTAVPDIPASGGIVGGPLLDEALADAVAAGQIHEVQTQGPVAFLQWNGTGLSVTVTPIDGDGSYYDADQFAELLADIGYTDETAWLAELPDRVVIPATRHQVISELLDGVPLVDGTSPESIAGNNNLVQDRLNVASQLQQQVVCSWLRQYFQDGTTIARTAAAEALKALPDWPVSQELETADVPSGVILSGSGIGPLTINEDETIVYDSTNQELDGYTAAQVCNFTNVG